MYGRISSALLCAVLTVVGLFSCGVVRADDTTTVPTIYDPTAAIASLQTQIGTMMGPLFLLFCGLLVVVLAFKWVKRGAKA